MKVTFKTLTLPKLYPLAISRGTMSASENLFVTVEHNGLVGLGEHAPATGKTWTAERAHQQLKAFCARGFSLEPEETWTAMQLAEIDPPAMAALDIALWDLRAKQAGQPLYALLGLEKKSVATSVTIGINPPSVTLERVPDILRRTGAKCLKIKLGSPEGREHDREHFLAAKRSIAAFRIDPSG